MIKFTTLTLLLISGIVFSAIEPIYVYEADSITFISTWDYNPISVYGGYVNDITVSHSYAKCYIYGGTITSIAIADGYTEVGGGNISDLTYSDAANLKISGGNIDSIELGTRFWPRLNKIEVDCYSYNFYDFQMAPMGDSEGLISAKLDIVLSDGTAQIIPINYTDPIAGMQTPEYFFDFNIVPEPATLVLFGLGTILLRKKAIKSHNRDKHKIAV